MDATIVECHQVRGKTKDAEAGWCVKKNSRGKEDATYGYKVHSNCDEDGFILKQEVTAGNVYDGNKRSDLLTGEESQLYADSVYDSHEGRAELAYAWARKPSAQGMSIQKTNRRRPSMEQGSGGAALHHRTSIRRI